MYSEKVKAQLKAIIKHWTGMEEEDIKDLRDLKTDKLILALDEVRCDLVNFGKFDPSIPAILQATLAKRILSLATGKRRCHLKKELGEVKQVYQLVRPIHAYDLNMLFVFTSKDSLGVGYKPERGYWEFGHYNMNQKEAEQYIKERYGMAVPLLKQNN